MEIEEKVIKYLQKRWEKVCRICKHKKPITEFYTSINKQGYLHVNSYCENCERVRNRLKNRTPKRRQYNAQWRVKNQYDSKGFPRLRHWANKQVLWAIERGDLIKLPCAKCGEKKVEGHHSDYNKPLKVVWLCQKHHREAHLALKNLGIKENGI